MRFFFYFAFLFFIGSTIGWFIEVIYRKIKHGKWVNPGFLTGPYLPIYGVGLSVTTGLYFLFAKYNIPEWIGVILIGFIMTFNELISGLILLKNKIRLWDYSKEKLNYKGVICLKFTLIWIAAAVLYYLFLAGYVIKALEWFDNNLLFSYVLGMFTSVILIDTGYSINLSKIIKKFAKDNDIVVKYERLKLYIRDIQQMTTNQYSFLFPFKQVKGLTSYLESYKERIKKK